MSAAQLHYPRMGYLWAAVLDIDMGETPEGLDEDAGRGFAMNIDAQRK